MSHHSHLVTAAHNGWVTEECVPTATSSLLFFTGGSLLVASAVFYVLSDVMSRKTRIFHHLITSFLAVASLAYLAQAYGIGVTLSDNRCLFNLRYLELLLTTPLLLFALGLLSGTPLSEILIASVAASLMFAAQWSGVVLPTRMASWLMWGFSLLMWVPVLRTLIRSFPHDARKHQESATVTAGPTTDKLRASVVGLSLVLVAFTIIQHIMYVLTATVGKVTGETYVSVMGIVDLLTKVLIAIVLLSQRDVLEWRARAISQGQLTAEEGAGGLGKYRTFGESTSVTGTA